MTTGLRNATWQNLQLNAGVFLKNFDFSGAETVAALKALIADAVNDDNTVLGATVGGGSFSCKPMLRCIEADGLRAAAKGAMVNDGWTVRMKGTMLEITPGSFAAAMGLAETETSGQTKTVRARMNVADSDFFDTLCWVGDTSRGYVMIEMSNVLNMVGAELTFADRSEGRIPFDFQAHMDHPGDDYAPFRIVFLEDAAA